MYSVLIYLWLMPLTTFVFPWRTDHDIERLMQLVVFVITGVEFLVIQLTSGSEPRAGVQPRLAVFLALLATLALISTARAASAHSWMELALWCGLVLSALSLAQAVADDRVDEIVWGCVATGTTYALLMFGLCVMISLGGAPLLRTELFPGYSNYRFYNHVQTVLIPLLAAVSLYRALPRWASTFAYAALAFNFSMLLFTAGRATWVGLSIAWLFVFLIAGHQARRWLQRMAYAAMIGVGLYALVFVALPYLCGAPTDVSAADVAANTMSINRRFYLWKLALQDLCESPWFGIGPMQFAHRLNSEAAHPHNVALQIAAEWGAPMLILVVIGVVRGLLRMATALRHEQDVNEANIGAGLFAACIGLGVDSMFSGNFVMPISATFIALAIGWSIAWTQQRMPDNDAKVLFLPRPLLVIVAFALLIIQLWLLLSVRVQIHDLDERLDAVRGNVILNDHISPRFWSEGWF